MIQLNFVLCRGEELRVQCLAKRMQRSGMNTERLFTQHGGEAYVESNTIWLFTRRRGEAYAATERSGIAWQYN